MVIGGTCYVLMILANIPILHLEGHLTAQYAIGIPFNFLVGVGAPLLWTGQALYLSRTAELHVRHIGGGKAEQMATLSSFNATFFAMFQANGVVGLLFASLLKTFVKGDNVTTILFIILSIAAALGVFILSGLPSCPAIKSENLAASLEDPTAEDEDETDISIAETLNFMVTEPKLYFFIPIVLFNGMSLGFMFSGISIIYITRFQPQPIPNPDIPHC